MKTRHLIAFAVALVPSITLAQTIIHPDSFFDPDAKIRRNGSTSGLLALTVTDAPTTGPTSTANGNILWNHSAAGYAQVRADVKLLNLSVAIADAQLASYAAVTNDTLVFGREITTKAELLGSAVNLGNALETVANQVAGASIDYAWKSDATISNLLIVPDQLYRVDFNVTSGAGLPANLLSSSTFGITTPGITGSTNQSATLLNLLNVVSLGNNASTGHYSYLFKSNSAKNQLNFSFAATSVLDVKLLGGNAANQNVLTFSNFSVTQVPEPGSMALCGVFFGLLTFRRNRRQ